MAKDGDHTGDPGWYDPYTAQELANASKGSFGRSGKSGAGAFGASSARELKMQQAGQDTPGPGSYSQGGALGSARSCHAPSSAFRSSSAQRMKGAQEDTPGVGSYDPRMSAVEPSSNGAVSGLRGRSERFKAEQSTTDPTIGPGAYSTEASASIQKSVADAVLKSSRSGAGFGTRTAQHVLPINQNAQEVPGPGTYEPARPTGAEPKRPSSAFKSNTKRMGPEEEALGDPGAYLSLIHI